MVLYMVAAAIVATVVSIIIIIITIKFMLYSKWVWSTLLTVFLYSSYIYKLFSSLKKESRSHFFKNSIKSYRKPYASFAIWLYICVLYLFGAHLSFKSPFLPFLISTFTLCGAKFSFHIAHSFAHNILLLLVFIVVENERANEPASHRMSKRIGVKQREQSKEIKRLKERKNERNKVTEYEKKVHQFGLFDGENAYMR